MQIKTLIVAAGLAVLATAPALAQTTVTYVPGGVYALPPKERFAATDKNKDGKISSDEMKATLNPDAAQFIGAIMERADANADGFLSETEFAPPIGGGGRGPGGGRAGPPPQGAQAPAAQGG